MYTDTNKFLHYYFPKFQIFQLFWQFWFLAMISIFSGYLLESGLRLRKLALSLRRRMGLCVILLWLSNFCFSADRTLRFGSEAENNNKSSQSLFQTQQVQLRQNAAFQISVQIRYKNIWVAKCKIIFKNYNSIATNENQILF